MNHIPRLYRSSAANPRAPSHPKPLSQTRPMTSNLLRLEARAPDLGEHNEYVFKELLQMAGSEYQASRPAGVIQ
jgi:hypothetical protein